MGTDIHGFIECWTLLDDGDPGWAAAMSLDFLDLARNYDAFGCLFGVRNHANFAPLAAGRGLPDDVSDTAAIDFLEQGGHSESWVSWAQIQSVDWTEPTLTVDSRIHRYERDAAGHWQQVSKSAWSREFVEVSGNAEQDGTTWPEGTEWRRGDVLFRVERLRRSDAVPADWQRVWDVMGVLARAKGPENVRLVVWFDS